MGIWSLWLIIASIFLVTELLSQSVWALCIGLGALAAMVAALAGLDIFWQGIILVGICIISYIVLLPLLKKLYINNDKKISTGMDALIGRKAIVTESIAPGKLGRVKIDGDNWQIKARDDMARIPAGTAVEVLDYESIVLTVSPIEQV